MSAAPRSIVSPSQILATLRRHYLLWTIPTVVVTMSALVYAFVKPISWKASQALIVRDEANGSGPVRIGRFDNSDAMKAAQETLVQMSRNPSVVAAALREVGPPANLIIIDNWPSSDDVEQLQGAITVSPPKGGEFGRNEVIYLSVEGPTRQRAIDLTNAVCTQLELRMQELRRDKAQSLIVELDKATTIAQEELNAATHRLGKVERGVGRDLDELRTLSETGAGASNLRSSINQLRDEIRRVQLAQDSNSEQLKLLSAAQSDADRLLAAPQRLFETQPGLRRLKDGLVDAQLKTASLEGKMNAEHPDVKAARAGEAEIRHQLNNEVELVRSNLDADLKVSAAQLASLNKQLTETETRLNNVAVLRAEYVNLLSEVKQRGENLAKANKDLSDARASQAAAQSASLITRLDQPDPGNWPVGPGKMIIVLAGMAGGLIVGLGLVFLIAPLGNLWGRRWSDYLSAGRRASDRATTVPVETKVNLARRSNDLVANAAPATQTSRRASDRPNGQELGKPADSPAKKPK